MGHQLPENHGCPGTNPKRVPLTEVERWEQKDLGERDRSVKWRSKPKRPVYIRLLSRLRIVLRAVVSVPIRVVRKLLERLQ